MSATERTDFYDPDCGVCARYGTVQQPPTWARTSPSVLARTIRRWKHWPRVEVRPHRHGVFTVGKPHSIYLESTWIDTWTSGWAP